MAGESLRVLGLDVGDSRIGVAVSDPAGIVVTPLPAISRSKLEEDCRAVLRVAQEYLAVVIVVGMPISLNGRMGRQARQVRWFARALAQESPIQVHSQDERFSTIEAERLLRESGHKPSLDKGLRDSASAAVILRSYLDSRASP